MLAHTAQVVVYTHMVKVSDGKQTDGFACRVSTGAARAFVDPKLLLAQYDVEIPRATVKISGLFAGAVVEVATGSRGGPTITVIDLNPKHPKISFMGDPGGSGGGPVTALALSSSGKVAWITSFSSGRATSYAVVEGVGSSKRRILDKGRKISPRSLGVTGSTLTWVNAGHRRTHTL